MESRYIFIETEVTELVNLTWDGSQKISYCYMGIKSVILAWDQGAGVRNSFSAFGLTF